MRSLVPIMAAMLALAGCSVSQDKAAGEAAVEQFHQLLDAGRFHDIYAGSEPEFRQTGSEQAETAELQRIHDRLGGFRSSRETSWRVNFNPAGNIVTLDYESQFASGPGTENFVFRVRGNAARLAGYHVNSPALAAAPAATSAKPSEQPAPPAEVKPADAPAPGQSVVSLPDPPPPPGGK